jgi:hypothetical protein
MVDLINTVLGYVIDAIIYPFRDLSPWISMMIVSLLTSLLMLLVYRMASDQKGIRAVKDKILAHLLELRLYKDSLPISSRAQGNILVYNLKYLGYSLKPLMFMIVPMVLMIIQLDLWFGYQSLKSGESAIVKVRLKDGSTLLDKIVLETLPEYVIETPPLRIEKEAEVDWRIRATVPGNRDLAFRVNNQTVTKQMVVGAKSMAKTSPARVARNWFDQLLNPGEPVISELLAVKKIEIDYPARRMILFGWNIHWLVAFFMLSTIFALTLKRIFRIEI